MPTHFERNLLFGVLAMRAGLVDDTQLAEICSTWAQRKSTSVADYFIQRGWLTAEDRHLLIGLLDRSLAKHGNLKAGMAAAATYRLHDVLAQLSDPEIRRWFADYAQTDNHAPSSSGSWHTRLRLDERSDGTRTWLARDETLDRDVVLKQLETGPAGDVAAREQFRDEARVLSRLEHPGVVPIYQFSPGHALEPPFYTSRAFQGQTLSDVIATIHGKSSGEGVPTMDLHHLLYAFLQACDTVSFAHSRGIAHRCLTSTNILLGEFGETTIRGWSVPSPATKRPADERRDINRLGAVLQEIVTGQPGLSGNGIPGTKRSRQSKPPAALRAIWCKAQMSSDKECYASVRELALDVRRWLAGEPVAAYPLSRPQRAARWFGKHRRLTAGVAALLGVVSVTGGLMWVKTSLDRSQLVRVRTEEKYHLARSALDATVATVLEAARLRARDLAPIRRDLMAAPRDFYEHITHLPQSGQPQNDEADGNLHLAEIGALTHSAHLTLDPANQAETIFTALLKRDPDSSTYRAGLARSLNLQGLGHLWAEQSDAALAAFTKSVPVLEKLVEEEPAVAKYRWELVLALNRLGLLAAEGHGDRVAAEHGVRRAQVLIEALVRQEPTNADFQSEQAQSCAALGYLTVARGDRTEGLRLLEKALAIWEGLLRQIPDVPQYQQRLVNLVIDMALQAGLLHDPHKVKRYTDQGIPVAEVLARSGPSRDQQKTELANLRLFRAIALCQLGDPARAVEETEYTLRITSAPIVRYNAGCAFAQAGAAVLRDTKRPAAERQQLAEAHFRRAVKLLRQGGMDARTIREDPDLKPLQGREDFNKLLHERSGGG